MKHLLRSLLSLALVAGTAGQASADLNPSGMKRTRDVRFVARGLATRLMPIETGNTILGTTANGITTGQALQDTRHTIRGAGSGLVLTLSGVEWDTMRGEIALPTETVQAQIIPDDTGVPINVTCGGSTTCTVGGGLRYLDTDPIARPWTDGQQFTLRVLATGTRLPSTQPAGTATSQIYTDEACQTATSGLTLAAAPVDNFTRRRRLSVVVGIFAQRPTTDVTIAALGDSIMAYQTSTLAANSATSDHVRGDIVRSISQYYATINLGIGGDQPSSALYTDRTLQRLLARRATAMIDENGVNEFNNRAISGAAAWAFHNRLAATFSTLRYLHSTLVPITSGTFADEAGQTAVASGSKTVEINNYNGLVRATTNYVDRRATIQGVDPNKWAAGYALDGLHPTLAAINALIATKATLKAAVDASASPSSAQPSIDLTLSGTPTFAGLRFVRGTATGDGIAASALSSTCEFWFSATGTAGIDVLCGSAGRVVVNSGGVLVYTRQSTGTQTAGTTIVTDGVERFVRIATTISGTIVSLGSSTEITYATAPNAVTTNTRIVATVANGLGSIRDLASYASDRSAAAIPAAGAAPANDNTMVGYWPLAANGTGTFGAWLGSL